MLFNSIEFIFGFLPFILLGLRIINRYQLISAVQFIALSSLFFYSWDSLSALPLLLASILINYFIGSILSNEKNNNKLLNYCLLVFGIIVNLSGIIIFKYLNFIIDNLNILNNELNFNLIEHVNISLPTGISFYTFTQIAFLVDSYKKQIRNTKSSEYILFVSFFPHLIAGPLLFHKSIFPQFKNIIRNSLNSNNIMIGVILFSIGLSKKVLIADNLAYYIDSIYFSIENGTTPMLFISWIATIGYTLQLYFDFSGYSDMAIGLALLCGIKIPVNFNSPYKSTSIIEFWTRWHISLSIFLKEYLYIYLGGNRGGEIKKYRNIIITMILGGIWHGASYTFILWGFIHSILIIINHIIRKYFANMKIPINIKWIITFFAINLTWLVFRSPNMDVCLSILSGVFGLNGISVPVSFSQNEFLVLIFNVIKTQGIWQGVNSGMGIYDTFEIVLLIILSLFIVFYCPNSMDFCNSIQSPSNLKSYSIYIRCIIVLIISLLWVSIMNFNKPSPFLYFRF